MEAPTTKAIRIDATTSLTDVHRRLVGIHAALAERTSIDAEVRAWTIHELMDVLRYIEGVKDQPAGS